MQCTLYIYKRDSKFVTMCTLYVKTHSLTYDAQFVEDFSTVLDRNFTTPIHSGVGQLHVTDAEIEDTR